MRGIFEKLKRPRNCCLELLPPMVWRKLKETEVALAQKLYDEKGLSAAKIARLFDPSAMAQRVTAHHNATQPYSVRQRIATRTTQREPHWHASRIATFHPLLPPRRPRGGGPPP